MVSLLFSPPEHAGMCSSAPMYCYGAVCIRDYMSHKLLLQQLCLVIGSLPFANEEAGIRAGGCVCVSAARIKHRGGGGEKFHQELTGSVSLSLFVYSPVVAGGRCGLAGHSLQTS